jgi:hypothetical protein
VWLGEEGEGGIHTHTRTQSSPPQHTPQHTHTHHPHPHTHTQAIPAALLPPALSLALEEKFLHMATAAPATDTDHFDKGTLNSEQLQMMEEERLARKL